jgi:hypothetical protein
MCHSGNDAEILLTGLENGVYFLKVIRKERFQVYRLVIQSR